MQAQASAVVGERADDALRQAIGRQGEAEVGVVGADGAPRGRRCCRSSWRPASRA